MMIRPAPPPRTFEWTVIAFTGVCVAVLYGLVATDYLIRAARTTLDASSGAASAPAAESRRSSGLPIKPTLVQYVTPFGKLQDVFDRIGYKLDGVRRHGEVPRVFLVSLPADLQQTLQPSERKTLFIKTALPLILHANEIIRHERAKIAALRDRVDDGQDLDEAEQAWLDEKAEDYGLEDPDFAELLQRIDIIPPSLALAQAAAESGWGTSRFAREGNAIFGQRTWRRHSGIVPERRDEGKTFRVRIFDQLIDGVRSYTRNLNGHFAYEAFRKARADLRRHGEPLDGYRLAATLTKYSEQGTEYVETIRTIIRVNGLRAFDRARLRDRRAVDEIVPDA